MGTPGDKKKPTSGPTRDWLKIKTQAWLEANRERRRLFELRSRPRQVRE